MRLALTLIMTTLINGCGQTVTFYVPVKGPKGDAGESITGPTGSAGQDAISCTASKVGPVTTVSCPDGTSSTIVDGSDGTNGVDATPITVIPLCPGTTTYGTTYVEVAFCIGGKLYATYSANGGFSTEIPPGTYSSNGVNSSCTFTVSANCQVN